ncbi:MAG TPA: hypothetical protein VGI40_13090 [Pirellulaceae bacterium]|jgi:hypothetical protein
MSQELAPAASSFSPPPSSFTHPPRHAQNHTRNLAIFKKVVLENFTHQEVAAVYNLDKSRVTQIVARVRRRLAQADRDDPNIHNPLARQRLETQIEQMRLEFILNTTTDALLKQPTSLSTVKQGTSDYSGTVNKWNVVTTRDIAPTAQLINAYLRVTRRIGELRDSQTKDHPIPDHLQQDDLLRAIFEALSNWLTASAKFAEQPSDQFKTAAKNFRTVLGRYLTNRRAGFSPSDCWPEISFQEMRARQKAAQAQQAAADQPAKPTDVAAVPTDPSSVTSGATAGSPSSAPPQELTNAHHPAPNTHQPLTAPPTTFHLPTSIAPST